MFGGRPTQKKPANQTNASEFDIDNIDHLLHDNFNDNSNIGDENLNDPDLLSQLNALASSSSKMESQAKTKKPAKKVVPQVSMDIDLDAYSSLAQGGDDIEVELDERDFSDPTLLNELSSLSQTSMVTDKPATTLSTTKKQSKPDEKTVQLMNMGFSQKQAKKALDMFDSDIERATNYLLDTPPTDDYGDDRGVDDHIDTSTKTTDHSMDQDTNTLVDTTMTYNNVDNDTSTSDSKKSLKDSTMAISSHVTTTTIQKSDSNQHLDKYNNDGLTSMDLKSRSQHYQQLALAAKKQGDKKLAVSYLRESKALMQLYQQQQSLLDENIQKELNIDNNNDNDNVSTVNNEALSPLIKDESSQDNKMTMQPDLASSTTPYQPSSALSAFLPSPQQQTANLSTTNLNDLSEISTPPTQITNKQQQQEQQELLQQIIHLQKEYKEAAIHYKNIGNLSMAKEMIQTSKSLLKTGIQVKQGGLSLQEIASIKTKLPPPPDKTLGDGKLRTVQPVTSFQQPTIEQLETQLSYQIDVCHNLEIQYRNTNSTKSGSKESSTGLSNAALLPLKQAFAADLVTIKSLHEQENNNNLPSIPSLHYEQVDYSYNHILDHLALNQMELKIIKGTGIQTLDIGADVEPFVTWDFAGWPPENTAQAQLNKGETPIVKGINPVFDFTTVIPIVRSNRVFIRHVQRKKLTLEIYHNKYNYGFLRRPVFIGKIIIPLEGLLTKSSIRGWFDLVDNNRKKLGGKLEVQLNIREPLNGQDIIKRSERWLILDEFSQQTSQLLYSAGLTKVPYVSPNIPLPSSSSNDNITSVDTTTTITTSIPKTDTMETITAPMNMTSPTLSTPPLKQESKSASSSPLIPNKNQLQKDNISLSPSLPATPDLTMVDSELENAEDELNK
ncbi:unnamed protein product [Cunninghamella echinulata]